MIWKRAMTEVPESGSDEIATLLSAAQHRGAAFELPYYGAVTPAQAQRLLELRPDARLVDVRTRAEWDYVGRVPDSILIEWNTYPAGTRNPAFLEQLRAAVPASEAPVLFLCRSGQRSDGAARAAQAAGYSHAMNVLEGFEGDKDAAGQRGHRNGWRHAGLPWTQG
jgi:rhodanese-related sulfurtransferase